MRPGGAGEAHGAEKLQREALRPIGLGKVQKFAALGRAGVVDHDVDATEAADGVIGQARGVAGVAQVQRQGARRASSGFDLGDELIQRGRVARAGYHPGAFARQPHGDRAADAFARAGDDGGFVLKFHISMGQAPRIEQ